MLAVSAVGLLVGYVAGLALRDHPALALWTLACVVSGALVAWLTGARVAITRQEHVGRTRSVVARDSSDSGYTVQRY